MTSREGGASRMTSLRLASSCQLPSCVQSCSIGSLEHPRTMKTFVFLYVLATGESVRKGSHNIISSFTGMNSLDDGAKEVAG